MKFAYQFASIKLDNVWMWQLTKQCYLLFTHVECVTNLIPMSWCFKFSVLDTNIKIGSIKNKKQPHNADAILHFCRNMRDTPGSVAWDILLRPDHQKWPLLPLLHTFVHFHCIYNIKLHQYPSNYSFFSHYLHIFCISLVLKPNKKAVKSKRGRKLCYLLNPS